jgi:hypothetical protein
MIVGKTTSTGARGMRKDHFHMHRTPLPPPPLSPTLNIARGLISFIRYIPRNVSIVVLINSSLPLYNWSRMYPPVPPPAATSFRLAIFPNVDMSFVKLVIRNCTSGPTLPNFTCVLAPLIATGIIDDRTNTFVRDMHAQYGRWRCR